ncbi:MAG: WYL domain-containing protein, partial [Chlamydiia bacterium]|nr:WYL domain-containing protein [Chlamydiia bacterium]
RTRSVIQIVRFAGANRLCVDLEYVDANGKRSTQLIEPYSLRQSLEGNILLMAVRADNGEVRSYRVDGIYDVKVASQKFAARYEVEISAG